MRPDPSLETMLSRIICNEYYTDVLYILQVGLANLNIIFI